jgi:hypothetical protein
MLANEETTEEQEFASTRLLPTTSYLASLSCRKRQGRRDLNGERGGTRTHDPMIKSHVLYRLSYALTCRAV